MLMSSYLFHTDRNQYCINNMLLSLKATIDYGRNQEHTLVFDQLQEGEYLRH